MGPAEGRDWRRAYPEPLRVEQAIHRPRRLIAQTGRDVAVGVESQRDCTVAEQVLDQLRMGSGLE